MSENKTKTMTKTMADIEAELENLRKEKERIEELYKDAQKLKDEQLKVEKDKRKAEVDKAYKVYSKLLHEYIEDYGSYSNSEKTEKICNHVPRFNYKKDDEFINFLDFIFSEE